MPVYHPVFMDQAYRLLRSLCIYCHHFRISRKEIHRYECMLRLLQVGLLEEAQMIDALDTADLGEAARKLTLSNVPRLLDDEAVDDGDPDQNDIVMRSREDYVRRVLQKHREEISLGNIRKGKHEGASEKRRELVKEFLARIVLEKKCRGCGGISPVYRKDRYVKIFERDLNEKEKAQMAQEGKKRYDALALARRAQKPRYEQDEGIADIDMSEGEAGAEDEGQGDDLDESGDVVMGDVTPKAKTKRPSRSQRYLSALEVKERLNLLFEKEQDIMSLLYSAKPRPKNAKPFDANMFFLQTLLVPPNRYRPEVGFAA